jgi:hypothetical protein
MTEEIKQKRSYKGSDNPSWKGGIKINSTGYILIHKPEHPNCNAHGYVRLHRLIYEEFYKCCLLKFTELHHINENRTDNRIENLIPMYKSQHMSLHKSGTMNMLNRICLLCGSDKTRRLQNNNLLWLNFKDGFICHSCYYKQRYRNYKKHKNC